MTRGAIAALISCGLVLACSTPDKSYPDNSAPPREPQSAPPEKSQPMNPCSERIRKLLLEGDLSTPMDSKCHYVPTSPDAYITELGGKDAWVRKFPRR